MDFESIKAGIEIIDKVVEQWQRTGRLNGIERAFLLDKLREIEAAVLNAECKMQNAECAEHEIVAKREEPVVEIPEVSFTVDISEMHNLKNTEQDVECVENHAVAVAAESSEIESIPNDEHHDEYHEEHHDEHHEEHQGELHPVEQVSRRGRLGRKAIRSLYDDLPKESLKAECKMQNAECEMQDAESEKREVVGEDELPARETLDIQDMQGVHDTHDAQDVQESPENIEISDDVVADGATSDDVVSSQDSVQTERDAIRKSADFAIHKKVVLGEILNRGGSTVGESIAPQAMKRIGDEKVSDLRKAMGLNDRYIIMRDLFAGDVDAFDEALTQLNAFDDLNDAMLFIHDTYQWNHNSDGAQLLVDIIVRKLM